MAKIIKTFLILVSLCLISCGDIFERDLSKTFVEIYSPPDNYTSIRELQTFTWEEVEDVSYRLQIVSGTFTMPVYYVTDTLISKNRYEITLVPGKYEWRIAAENSTSRSPFNTHSLTIDTTSNLSSQLLTLISPSDNAYLNNNTVTFNWQTLSAALNYQFQLSSPDFTSAGNVVIDTAINAATISLTIPTEGSFSWRTKAMNNNSETSFSQTFKVIIDTTSPATPILQQPTNNSIVSAQPVQFSWLRDQGTQGSPLKGETISIFTDSLLSNTYSTFFTTSTTVSDTIPPGTYYWHVKSTDLAGNSSPFSNTGKFIVQ